MNPEPAPEKIMRGLAFTLAVLSFGVLLAAQNLSDNDLWGKLAIGAHVWNYGTVPESDSFAFTPVLSHYVEHEWGAGTIFFGVLKFFGPAGLMVLKILLAFGAMFAAMATARRTGADWNALMILAIPVASCLLLGYVPVVRSHTFTYCFFAVTLLFLEKIRAGRTWPAFLLPAMMLVWSNIHGGFVAGLGAVAVYAFYALVFQQRVKLMLSVLIACGGATLINIYGIEFWKYLIPALLHKRPHITEWQPLPLFAKDAFLAFRILFLTVVILFVVTWRRTEKRSWPGLIMLALTAMLAWRSRRHAPFFAIAALAFTGPFLEVGLQKLVPLVPWKIRNGLKPLTALLVLYGLVTLYVAVHFLPRASFVVLAPVGDVPVREVDILSRAQVDGNLATPFGWGGYCSWRLYPQIKVSMDSRYETTYPESTFEMNFDFYARRGTNWDRLIREYPVDFVVLDFQHTLLRPEDLFDHGYGLVWITSTNSALMALEKHTASLQQVAAGLPPTTIDPVDATIPDKWWSR